jgi:hypothetical protein
MSLKHFIVGAGEHAHMLGASAVVKPDSEVDKVYSAELGPMKDGKGTFTGWQPTTPEASKTVDLNGARKFVSKTLFHSEMDSIPGIDKVRKNFDPKTDVLFSSNLSDAPAMISGPTIPSKGKPNRLLLSKEHFKDGIGIGWLTHEVSHMLNPLHHGHSWNFARTHLHVVKTMLGDKAHASLKKHYDKHGVDYGRTA